MPVTLHLLQLQRVKLWEFLVHPGNQDTVKNYPFHSYSMKQAIQEGFYFGCASALYTSRKFFSIDQDH